MSFLTPKYLRGGINKQLKKLLDRRAILKVKQSYHPSIKLAKQIQQLNSRIDKFK